MDDIETGDRVVVINPYGLKIEAKVVAVMDNHGLKTYRVASESFFLTVERVERSQIAEIHKQ
jgi:hypothetical protein